MNETEILELVAHSHVIEIRESTLWLYLYVDGIPKSPCGNLTDVLEELEH